MDARLREALDACDIMTLATTGEEGSWASPVGYRYHEENKALQLTFLSRPTTRHAQNIAADSRVSAAIFAYHRTDGGNVGLQIKGTAHDEDTFLSDDNWHTYRIDVAEAWIIDTRDGQRRGRERIL